MTLLHDYFHTRNLQSFQRLLALDGANGAGHSTAGGPHGGAEQSKGAHETPGTSPSSGAFLAQGNGPRSWTRGMSAPPPASAQLNRNACDPNVRDRQGRTALHLACSSLESIEYVRALLKHPHIDVNAVDQESHWTALHRALYVANVPAALMLLQRSDLISSVKDSEGYTAFDLFNSTLHYTKPGSNDVDGELYTWGANRNATLGLGDGDDRMYPEHVVIKSKKEPEELENAPLMQRFWTIRVGQVQMSRLHTAVVTKESEGNIRLCGYGSGGRLGTACNTQHNLNPLGNFSLQVVDVSLGQDHTLILTKNGEVYSWGLNRFLQLGYVVEAPNTVNGRSEETAQSTPKRIVGPLRKDFVIGIAASKVASACWSEETVYTWGTNTGQLGYDKIAQPVQIIPRPVTKFSNKVISLAMSDTILCALLVTNNVECIWNDVHHRVIFPIHAFPSGIRPYRPPQAVKDSWISKITSCDDTFAALSRNGEVFTFTAPSASTMDSSTPDKRQTSGGFKPQRVWALRKKFSSVKDVALGSDGSIIICTESGHVFVRTRNGKLNSVTGGQKAFKFERVPFLQRIKRVCANAIGSFGALKFPSDPLSIQIKGNTLAEDLKHIQPYLAFYPPRNHEVRSDLDIGPRPSDAEDWVLDEDEEKRRWKPLQRDDPMRTRQRSTPQVINAIDEEAEEDPVIDADIHDMVTICQMLEEERVLREEAGGGIPFDGVRLPFDADCLIYVKPGGMVLPVHSVILAARSASLKDLLEGAVEKICGKRGSRISRLAFKPGFGLGAPRLARLSFEGYHPVTVAIFLRYLYSDEVLSVWDSRIALSSALRSQLLTSRIEFNTDNVRTQLQEIAEMLGLNAMSQVLSALVRRTPTPTMVADLSALFKASQESPQRVAEGGTRPDVLLRFADNDVWTHSVILRARSDFFASFLGLKDWSAQRWKDGTLTVDLSHLKWDVMQFVVRFMCAGCDEEQFYHLEFLKTIDDVLTFMFNVLACANEFLLDRLVLLCSAVILKFVNVNNACYILGEATHYHALQLIESLEDYIMINLETFLESRLLDELPHALIKHLSFYISGQQKLKSRYSRTSEALDGILAKHCAWVDDQDWPTPILPKDTGGILAMLQRDARICTTKLSPSAPLTPAPSLGRKGSRLMADGSAKLDHPASPKTPRQIPAGDDIFLMDGLDSPSVTHQELRKDAVGSSTSQVWKAPVAPRVDMKAILDAEAAKSMKNTTSHQLPSAQRTGSIAATSTPQLNFTAKPFSPSTPSMSSATWRAGANVSSSTSQGANSSTLPSTPLSASLLPKTPTKAPLLPSTSQAKLSTPNRTPSGPALGPIITPVRESPSKVINGPALRSNGKAWTSPAQAPLPPPKPTVTSTGKTKAISFLDIQQSQKAVEPPKDSKKSLKDIQEEEAALQAEADFLMWWTAEEERMRQEEARAVEEAQRRSRKAKDGRPGTGGPGGSGKTKPSHGHGKAKANPTGDASEGGPASQRAQKGDERRSHAPGPSPKVPFGAETGTRTEEQRQQSQNRRNKKPSRPKEQANPVPV